MGVSDNTDRFAKSSFFFFLRNAGFPKASDSYGMENVTTVNLPICFKAPCRPHTHHSPRPLAAKVTTVAGYPAGSQEGVGEDLQF